MKTTNELMEMYLADKELAWATTTLKSERHRLTAALPHLDGNPATLWAALKDHGAYGRLTIWTRVSDFWGWMIDNGHTTGNPYKVFKQKNARQFKNVYTKKTPQITYQEARERIAGIKNLEIRNLAVTMLSGGLRFCESQQVDSDGSVVGKGSKRRQVYVQSTSGANVPYQQLRRALAKVGIKPHDLRKLFATRLVEEGANEFQLCEMMGWESIQTASSYVKANQSQCAELAKKVQGGTTNVTKEQAIIVLR